MGNQNRSVGVSLSGNGGKTTVSRIRRGSAAEDAGLSVNDEIIGCNGMRVDKIAFEDFLSSLRVGDEFSILIARDQQLYSLTITVTPYEKPKFEYKPIVGDKKAAKLNDYWLRTIE